MNMQIIKSAWRRWKKPSRATLQQLEQAGAKVDYWPDYQPRVGRNNPMASLDTENCERMARVLASAINHRAA